MGPTCKLLRALPYVTQLVPLGFTPADRPTEQMWPCWSFKLKVVFGLNQDSYFNGFFLIVYNSSNDSIELRGPVSVNQHSSKSGKHSSHTRHHSGKQIIIPLVWVSEVQHSVHYTFVPKHFQCICSLELSKRSNWATWLLRVPPSAKWRWWLLSHPQREGDNSVSAALLLTCSISTCNVTGRGHKK